jgi:hypothetical protein
MTNPIVTCVLAASCCMGLCIGGAINAYDAAVMKDAIESPELYHLVDKQGNPVSQEFDQP